MDELLAHMSVTVEAVRDALACMDMASLEAWRPADGAPPSSPETFLGTLIVEEMAGRMSGWKPRLTLIVDNENGGPF